MNGKVMCLQQKALLIIKLLIYDAQIGDFLNINALGDVKTIGILKVDKMMFNINVLDNISMSI